MWYPRVVSGLLTKSRQLSISAPATGFSPGRWAASIIRSSTISSPSSRTPFTRRSRRLSSATACATACATRSSRRSERRFALTSGIFACWGVQGCGRSSRWVEAGLAVELQRAQAAEIDPDTLVTHDNLHQDVAAVRAAKGETGTAIEMNGADLAG